MWSTGLTCLTLTHLLNSHVFVYPAVTDLFLFVCLSVCVCVFELVSVCVVLVSQCVYFCPHLCEVLVSVCV